MNKLSKEQVNENIVKDYNSFYDDKVETIEEVLDILSERFGEIYDDMDDAQDAYNSLVDEFSELMNKYCFVYTLSNGNGWSVSAGPDYKEEDLDEYLKIVNEHYYDYNHNSLDDILSSIENDVRKTMSNVGCDMFAALNLILSEDLHEFCDADVFVIEGASEEPRIEILY